MKYYTISPSINRWKTDTYKVGVVFPNYTFDSLERAEREFDELAEMFDKIFGDIESKTIIAGERMNIIKSLNIEYGKISISLYLHVHDDEN